MDLPDELAHKISEASILPDLTPDIDFTLTTTKKGNLKVKETQVRHHSEKAKQWAWKYLYKARRQYLKGNQDWVEPLGRALHYIQDYTVGKNKTVLRFFKVKSWDVHNTIENSISKCAIPRGEILRASKIPVSANVLKAELSKSTLKENADAAMAEATYLTALALRGVLEPTKPEGLEENFRKSLKRHLTIVGLPLFGTVISYIFGRTDCSVALLLLSVLGHYLDYNFHQWDLERRWFYK
ncbi:MAG: hypothetical protein PWP19_1182 [Thermococcaceae archaeon]|uniref:hypothetical protein n=1 Tax=Pyrococcus sp. TaxID=33866 RepID=UPI00258D06B0|nr:hypothetical protein [Pyrococcus sp.]MDK2870352.1 hypothetical protein [Pyrococcus sp.]MDK2983704.1 hypothetical protein [Thermococcaceae archaeon]